ncbi:MAG: asparagine--tRNA ligase, partial [Halobacteriovoraceae bacterium]|nr:asparagine--tRNA ligase [Halobacteriovoraceae bacterium]
EVKRITYTEAIDILTKSGKKFEFKPEWGVELQTEHERYLAEEYFKGPLTVTDYPKDCKAFYMKQNSDGKTVRAMDLLVPGVGEIIGGSQREEDLDRLTARMKDMNIPEDPLWWYLDLRKYGTAPHSGFGLGFERALRYVTGMKNIRDVIPFARSPRNCDF